MHRKEVLRRLQGLLMPKKIEFVWAKTSDKKITLNHTDKNATISADIVSGSEGLGLYQCAQWHDLLNR